jgi:hypothetical protein
MQQELLDVYRGKYKKMAEEMNSSAMICMNQSEVSF